MRGATRVARAKEKWIDAVEWAQFRGQSVREP